MRMRDIVSDSYNKMIRAGSLKSYRMSMWTEVLQVEVSITRECVPDGADPDDSRQSTDDRLLMSDVRCPTSVQSIRHRQQDLKQRNMFRLLISNQAIRAIYRLGKK